jgi:transcriptional regulator with XRE-family HTH domain
MSRADHDDHPIWGDGVKALRGLYGMTQTDLATVAGTTQTTISRIENGSHEISDALRVRIARALHTDPHALFPYREGVA